MAIALSLLAIGGVARASGSYRGQAPRPPAIDESKYLLGKQVYTGRAHLTPPAESLAAAQEPRLRDLEERLRARTGESQSLIALAGKLTPDQLESLAYYLGIRYQIGAGGKERVSEDPLTSKKEP